jgi:hypothetical protein
VEGKLVTAIGSAPAGTVLGRITADPDIAANGARSLGLAGKVPILLVNNVGKGRAILLNFAVGSYSSARSDKRAETWWALFKGLLARANVQPRVSIRTAEGGLRKCEAVFYRDGVVEYLGFLKYRYEPPQDAEVVLDRKAHTYDVRAGEYLGNVDRFPATFQIERGKLYARLPYAVKAIDVKLAKASPGEAVAIALGLTASSSKTGRHWFHIQVFGPDKVERRHYAQNVAVVNGKGQAVIPLALNDAPGAWRIVARDVASGVRAEATLEVQAPTK